MFSAVFKFFLVQVLICIIVSGFYSERQPQAALFARCMGVLGLVAMLLGAVIALPFGGREDMLAFMGKLPILTLCIIANVAQRQERRNNFKKL